jgi:hypothetical protein
LIEPVNLNLNKGDNIAMKIKRLGYVVAAVLVSGFTEALIFEQSSATAQTSGCGSGRSWYLLRVMTPISAKQFKVACNEHDACYDIYGKSKEECDKAFHNRMLGICARDHNTIVGRPLRIACNGRADAFYRAVLEYGRDSYNQGQAAAKPAPGSLASLHSSCSGDPQSPDCVAAIHRACNQRGAGGGISQEVGNGGLSVACFDTKWFGDISIDELRTQHPGCDSTGKSQSSDCVAAVHRACNVRGAGGGISQEVGNGVLGVACFDTKWFGDISIDELRTQHPGCDSTGKSRSSDCVAAIHRACNVRGAGGGIAQEVGNGVLGVACFDTKWYGDIPMR